MPETNQITIKGGMMGQLIMWVFLAILAILALNENSEKNHPVAAKPSAQEMGIEASLAASFIVDAQRQCGIIGIQSIDQCANQNGTLLDEISAKSEADLAVLQRNSYWKDCHVGFSQDYCTSLLNRAMQIEWSKPATPQPQ